MTLGCGRNQRVQRNQRGQHINRALKGFSRPAGLNPEPCCCEVMHHRTTMPPIICTG